MLTDAGGGSLGARELAATLRVAVPSDVPTVVYIKVREVDVPLGNSTRFDHPWAIINSEHEAYSSGFPRSTSSKFRGKPPSRLFSQSHSLSHNCKILTKDAYLSLDYQRPSLEKDLLVQLHKKEHAEAIRSNWRNDFQLICRDEEFDFEVQVAICLRALGRI